MWFFSIKKADRQPENPEVESRVEIIYLIDEAVKDGENKLRDYIDLTLDIDRKCIQFMGYMLTTGVVMIASAGSIAISGKVPLYGMVILSFSGISMILGFCAGIRAITGDIAISGIDPDDWIKAIDGGAGRESIARGRLEWLQNMVSGSRDIAKQTANRFSMLKKWAITTTFATIITSSIFIWTDMENREVKYLKELYEFTPKLGPDKTFSDIPYLSGKRIVYVDEHPYQPERFEASGRWWTVVHMAGPIGFTGSWKQEGSQVCVEIEHSDWEQVPSGETLCRDIQVRDEGLFIMPMTEDGEGKKFEFKVEPIN